MRFGVYYVDTSGHLSCPDPFFFVSASSLEEARKHLAVELEPIRDDRESHQRIIPNEAFVTKMRAMIADEDIIITTQLEDIIEHLVLVEEFNYWE